MVSEVSPRSIEEAATWLAELGPDERVRIVGAGTNQRGCPPAARILSTRGFDWVDLRAGDLTVAVGAGVLLSELQSLLATAGLRLAIDPVADGTIGGVVATGSHGALVWRYGTIRDLVIGATLVLADGTVAHSGGHVIKNVAGYDLAKLVCGAYGRLALIAEVVLRVHALPACEGGVVAVVAPRELTGVLEHLRRARLEAVAMDWVSTSGELLVVFEGTSEGVASQARRLCELLASDGLHPRRVEAAALAQLRAERADVRAPATGVVLRVANRASRLLTWLTTIGRRDGVSVGVYPGAGLADLVAAGRDVETLLELGRSAQAAGGQCQLRLLRDEVTCELRELEQSPARWLLERVAAGLDPGGRFV